MKIIEILNVNIHSISCLIALTDTGKVLRYYPPTMAQSFPRMDEIIPASDEHWRELADIPPNTKRKKK